MPSLHQLIKISDTVWELPVSYKQGMRVPARLFGTRTLIEGMDQGVFEQISNVACLPGIEGYACCMPDGHWGYGFPIGGVAAMRVEDGVISPGGIGFDINCGMRLVTTSLTHAEIKRHVPALVDRLFARVPAGVGVSGFLRIDQPDFREIMTEGAKWCVEKGYGWPEDLERTEENGRIAEADPDAVSNKAIERGLDQIGTLGSGNHYLEIQVVKENHIFDKTLADHFGLFPEQVVIMFHCGSRGFGHQVASDYLEKFLEVMGPKYGLKVPDRELACAPISSPEGQAYLKAMRCAINMSFANRQVILHRLREVFSQVLGKTAEELGMHQVYDVAHNTAKVEEQIINGKPKKLIVHRKGSTRAFDGQPVIIGGSMETGSYLLMGVPTAAQAFFSTAHGAGRAMSRTQARKQYDGRKLQDQMKERGIYVRSTSLKGLAEEAGGAYKNVDEVVESTEKAGLSMRVARFVPIGNVKG
jgi:tRNA-splicing ligase RtcB (3'-phosphate/5'-hydroxy nucleic acid ligase)